MKNTSTKLGLIVAVAFAAGTTTAFASEPTANQLAPYGYAASGGASRVVNLGGESKSLNVTQLGTVQLNMGGKKIVWTFDTLGTASFPLSKIVPGADQITVYVAKNPLYRWN